MSNRARAACRASSILDGSLPPACASSGLPPPRPPIERRDLPMMLPAWTRLVRSLVTAASRLTRSPRAAGENDDPAAEAARAGDRPAPAGRCRRAPSTAAASTLMPSRPVKARATRSSLCEPASLPAQLLQLASPARAAGRADASTFSATSFSCPSPARPSWRSVSSRSRTAASAPAPVIASIRRTPAATPASPRSLNTPMSPARCHVRAAAQLGGVSRPCAPRARGRRTCRRRTPARRALMASVVRHLLGDAPRRCSRMWALDVLLDAPPASRRRRAGMGEVEAQPLGGDQRAGLADVRSRGARAARRAGCGSRSDSGARPRAARGRCAGARAVAACAARRGRTVPTCTVRSARGFCVSVDLDQRCRPAASITPRSPTWPPDSP